MENPTGGVVLVGGQSGTVILDTLYRLSSLGPESGTGSGSGSKWEKMEQRLKMPRRFHTALMVPTSMTDCQREGNKVLISISIITYSQTCLQRPPLGPQKSSRCTEVAGLWRFFNKNQY